MSWLEKRQEAALGQKGVEDEICPGKGDSMNKGPATLAQAVGYARGHGEDDRAALLALNSRCILWI